MSTPPSARLHRTPSPDHGNGVAGVISYISRLELQDIQTLQERAQRGNSSVGVTDEELALALFAEEAEGLLNVAQGHVVDQRNDGGRPLTVFEELEEMEEVARYDHLVALAISQGTPIPPRPARRQRGTEQTTSSTSQGVPSTSRPLPFASLRQTLRPFISDQPQSTPTNAAPEADHDLTRPVPEIPRHRMSGPSNTTNTALSQTHVSIASASSQQRLANRATPIESRHPAVRESPPPTAIQRTVRDVATSLQVSSEQASQSTPPLRTDQASSHAPSSSSPILEADSSVSSSVMRSAMFGRYAQGRQRVDARPQSPTRDAEVMRDRFPVRQTPLEAAAGHSAPAQTQVNRWWPSAMQVVQGVADFLQALMEHIYGTGDEVAAESSEIFAPESRQGCGFNVLETYASSRGNIICAACGKEKRGAYAAPCGHAYDRECLSEIFRLATYDESLYPPSCCQRRIHIACVSAALPSFIVCAYVETARKYEACRRTEESAVGGGGAYEYYGTINHAYDSPRRTTKLCVVCQEEAWAVYKAPCGHTFDINCLWELFRRATHDESLYPPSCCQQHIALSSVRAFLPASVASAFTEKAREYDTRDRVYCHRSGCSAFLGAATAGPSSMHCSRCPDNAATCGMCKSQAHPDTTRCSDTQELSQLAAGMHAQHGWQRCYSCRHLVAKADGCHHITCMCSAQFCYLCAARWKTCHCPQFDVPPEA